MYAIHYGPSVERDIKKLDKAIIVELKKAHFPLIAEDPYRFPSLSGEFRHYRRYKFRARGVDYRIAYEIYTKKVLVLLVLIATRENFYKQLGRRVK